MVRKIFELDWRTHTLAVSGGTYSNYLETVAKRVVKQKEDYLLQQEEVERLTTQAREKRAESAGGSRWVGSDNDKFLRGFKREQAGRSGRVAKTLEKRIEQMEKVERPIERNPFEIPLMAEAGTGTLSIRLVDVVAGHENGFRIGPVSFEARYGDRIGIMGLNGSGKSTLLKTVTGQMPPVSGAVEIGSGVRFGNLMQEHETLPRDQTPLEYLMGRAELNQSESYNKLVKFGFDERQVKQAISTLSPGGRARLLLAVFSAESVNTLVLDEPTNHLDLEALEALEETLSIYKGTVLLVSHDRYFLEKAKLDYVYVLFEGVLAGIPDYQTYVAQAEERAQALLRSL